MPVPVLFLTISDGISSIPYLTTVLKIIPWIALIVFLKYVFGGMRNRSERVMHGKVIMVTVCAIPLSSYRLDLTILSFRVEHQVLAQRW